MPSMSAYRRKLSGGSDLPVTIGQVAKAQADITMEATWDNDIATRLCYLYSYWNDDELALNKGMTYRKTRKIPISAKVWAAGENSLSSDQAAFYLQFKPSQSVEFGPEDPLYFYETEFRERYNAEFPIGLYCDVPDDRGVYRRWLICLGSYGNQFVKYLMLPCDFRLSWIEQDGNKYIKRRMWGVLRSQSSYNSGLWSSDLTTSVENQLKIWLPLNSISDRISYTNFYGDKSNMLVIVSAMTDTPNVWQVSKVENTSPFGIQKITLYQSEVNLDTVYYDKETGGMYAGWPSAESGIVPEDGTGNGFDAPTDSVIVPVADHSVHCALSSSSPQIKVGGTFKPINIALFKDDEDVTADEAELFETLTWTIAVDGETVDESLYIIRETDSDSKVRLRFMGGDEYIGHVLTATATLIDPDDNEITDTIQFDIVST